MCPIESTTFFCTVCWCSFCLSLRRQTSLPRLLLRSLLNRLPWTTPGRRARNGSRVCAAHEEGRSCGHSAMSYDVVGHCRALPSVRRKHIAMRVYLKLKLYVGASRICLIAFVVCKRHFCHRQKPVRVIHTDTRRSNLTTWEHW